MKESPFRQAGLFRIVFNVSPEEFKRRFTSNQMIELIDLPELSCPSFGRIDFSAHKPLPFGTLRQHPVPVGEGGHEMNVIGHDNDVGQEISDLVERQQTVQYDRSVCGNPKWTSACTAIEKLVAEQEQVSLNATSRDRILDRQVVGDGIAKSDVLTRQVGLNFPIQDSQQILRKRIADSPGDETKCAGLHPVGQVSPFEHGYFLLLVEKLYVFLFHDRSSWRLFL